MTITNWLIIALFLSIMVNFLSLWYIRKLLAKVLFVSQNLTDLVDILATYRNHLKRIYSLDMYYIVITILFLMEVLGMHKMFVEELLFRVLSKAIMLPLFL